MNLKEFIEETVKQIIDGVIEAQKHAESKQAEVASSEEQQKVNFDVSVTVVEDKGIQGGAGLRILSIGASTDVKTETVHTQAHRIQFSIPVTFPPSAKFLRNREKLMNISRMGS